jgi:hypothetical protein
VGTPTILAAEAALSPPQGSLPSSEREISHPNHWALVNLQLAPRAMRTLGGTRDQLDLKAQLIAILNDALNPETIQADEAANVILHPLLLLIP